MFCVPSEAGRQSLDLDGSENSAAHPQSSDCQSTELPREVASRMWWIVERKRLTSGIQRPDDPPTNVRVSFVPRDGSGRVKRNPERTLGTRNPTESFLPLEAVSLRQTRRTLPIGKLAGAGERNGTKNLERRDLSHDG